MDDRENTSEAAFLRRAGKFAAVTPPLIATMLSVLSRPALPHGSDGMRSRSD